MSKLGSYAAMLMVCGFLVASAYKKDRQLETKPVPTEPIIVSTTPAYKPQVTPMVKTIVLRALTPGRPLDEFNADLALGQKYAKSEQDRQLISDLKTLLENVQNHNELVADHDNMVRAIQLVHESIVHCNLYPQEYGCSEVLESERNANQKIGQDERVVRLLETWIAEDRASIENRIGAERDNGN